VGEGVVKTEDSDSVGVGMGITAAVVDSSEEVALSVDEALSTPLVIADST
jgi:hypothetical protein